VMGDKISSRLAVEKAGVAGVPDEARPSRSSPTAHGSWPSGQRKVGWPVAIKAAFGAVGKRHRKVVNEPDEQAADALRERPSASR